MTIKVCGMIWYCSARRGIVFFDTLAVFHLKQLEHVAHAPGNAHHPLDHRQRVQHLQIIMQLIMASDDFNQHHVDGLLLVGS